ncbi:MAG: geranylgeranyl reductase family protein [Candidatus Hermodarchaeota archaeon]
MVAYDVIIAGAGTGGCGAAIAIAQKGFKVALIDRRPAEKIGDKVCGDGVTEAYFTAIENLGIKGIPRPKGEEFYQVISGAHLVSPDGQTRYTLEKEGAIGWILDRHIFGQRLLHDAQKFGAELIPETYVRDLIFKDETVIGVKIRKKDRSIQSLSSHIVIDASGVSTVLRRQFDPQKSGFEQTINPHDICYAYREIVEFDQELEFPHALEIRFDQKLASEGYFWIFPRSATSANVGLGVAATGHYDSPKTLFKKCIRQQELFNDYRVLKAGAARLPLRRPLDNLVENGFMLVGDAGCQVRPSDGGGIGGSMWAGAYASLAVEKAFNTGNYSKATLWSYNLDIMGWMGIENAQLQIIKAFITSLNNREILEMMNKGVIEKEDFIKLAEGSLPMSNLEKMKRVWRGKKIIKVLLGLNAMQSTIEEVKKHYRNYPKTPDEFPTWKEKNLSFFNKR